jgi:precorrin-8X/cobalt-precorrin-8 methylmutase
MIHPIDEQAFAIIEREVDASRFSRPAWCMLRRIVQAAGDTDLAEMVRWREGAPEAARDALGADTPVVVDVNMVAAGVRAGPLPDGRQRLHCFVADADLADEAPRRGTTRSRLAMERAVEKVGAAVYAIGNAPTALEALCDAVEAGAVEPAAVLALPVGFVGAAEAKDRALRLPCPVVALPGRRGGSGLAAAAVNGLLEAGAEARHG